MISKKLKTLISIGLSAIILGATAFSMLSNNEYITKALNPPTEHCMSNVRVTPNNDGGYDITHIGGDAVDVVIPATEGGYPITHISADAFDDCRDTLQSITIDIGVKIEDGAFNNMENVIDVTFTGDETSINYGHIFENTEIGTMTIPDNVTSVSEETFYGVIDTTNLIYEGTFNNFYNSIFHSLWEACCNTLLTSNYTKGSMPTNIEVENTKYYIPDNTSKITYIGYRKNVSHWCYYFIKGSSITKKESELKTKCAFGAETLKQNNTWVTTYYRPEQLKAR